MHLYQQIAQSLIARQTCATSGNDVWQQRHCEAIKQLVKDKMPSGSGIDTGTIFDFEGSNANRLVFRLSFHHMDEHGSYDGWTDHVITVRPSLAFGINIHITGRDRNQIKDYLAEIYQEALQAVTKSPQGAA